VTKDVVASYDTLVNIFERTENYLKRLKIYSGIPLTTDVIEILGKIMAQVLSVLALSTKEMKQRRISEPISSICPSSLIVLQRGFSINWQEERSLKTRCNG
jgi:hypothetical protein